MVTIRKEVIAEALDNAGIDPESIREVYSGKGMMGRECFGVVLNSLNQFALFVVELARTENTPEIDFAADLVDRVRQDAMGHSTIYYFPGYTLED